MPFLAKLKKAFIPVDPKRALDAPPGVSRPHVFMDISIGDQPAGRIELELFSDITPRTAENFKQLASGGHTSGGQKVGYAGSTFHRVVPEFMIQGGDFVNGNGTGMYSIYDGAFADENFKVKHQVSGLLSMANSGPNTNGCQFFITTEPADFLDGKHVAFGRVVKGMNVVRAIESTPTQSERPLQPVVITHCEITQSTTNSDTGANAVPTDADRAVGIDPSLSASGNSAAPRASAFEGTGAPVGVPGAAAGAGAGTGFSGGSNLNKVPTHTDTSRSPSDPNAPRRKLSVFADSGGDFADSSPVDRVRSNESNKISTSPTTRLGISTSPTTRTGVFATAGGDFADSSPVDRVRSSEGRV